MVLFIGYTGRKGEKTDIKVMSQTVKHASLNAKLPIFLIKRLYTRKEFPSFNWLVCVKYYI